MASMAKASLIGYLGADAELKYTPQGTAVCKLRLATNDRVKVNGEWQDKTIWWQIDLWGKQAENLSQYLLKGRQLFISGRVSLEEWQDREGNNRTSLKVSAEEVQLLGGKGDSNEQAAAAPREMSAAEATHRLHTTNQPKAKAAPMSTEQLSGNADDPEIPF